MGLGTAIVVSVGMILTFVVVGASLFYRWQKKQLAEFEARSEQRRKAFHGGRFNI